MERWRGRVVLVTGASRGIGRAICEKLIGYGIKVVACARSIEAIKELKRESLQHSDLVDPMRCDVSRESDVLAMFEEIKRKYGRIDICINNAGVIANAPLLSGATEDWKNVMEINVLGTCICTREAIKLMREKSIDGMIIQMGCIGGHKIASLPKGMPDPGIAIYNGTKFMIRALAEALRQELKSKDSRIRVSTISPGPVETAMLEKAKSPETASIFPSDLERLKPEEIADAVVYILKAPDHVNVDDVVVQHVSFPL